MSSVVVIPAHTVSETELVDLVNGGKPPAALAEFARDSGREGFVLLRGLPIGEIPPTHVDGRPATLSGHPTDDLLRGFADALGTMVGYAEEKGGALVHEVQPVPGDETRIENSGSVAFDFHTENVHHPLRPDYLGLLCLRQDHLGVAATRVASGRAALELLDPATAATLRQPVFHSNHPTSFTRGGAEVAPAGPHPVSYGDPARPVLRFNSHNTFAVTPAGRAALVRLAEALEEVCHDVLLEPGDCVIVDNTVAAHGRTAFVPRYDGRDRWLRRFYSVRSFPRVVQDMMAGSRVIPALSDIRGVW